MKTQLQLARQYAARASIGDEVGFIEGRSMNLPITVTFWDNLLATRACDVRNLTWRQFCAYIRTGLKTRFCEENHVHTVDCNKDTFKGFSPAKFKNPFRGQGRKNQHVTEITLLGLDCDKNTTCEQANAAFPGVATIAFTTKNHLHEKREVDPVTKELVIREPAGPRCRVFLQVPHGIPPKDFLGWWGAAKVQLFRAGIVVDDAPKDVSRFWYAPGVFLPEHAKCIVQDGVPFQPSDAELAAGRVAATASGARNNTLFKATVRTAKKHPPAEVRAVMAPAAAASGLPDDSSGRSIQSGIDRAGWVPEKGWVVNKSGNPVACEANILSVLREHPEWVGVLAYDQLGEQVIKRKPTPYAARLGVFEEHEITLLAAWVQSTFGMIVKPHTLWGPVAAVARETLVNELRDYLESLKWDGTPRLDTWLIDFCEAEDSPYVRAVSSQWMIGAVARALSPGCKMDTALTVEGAQGLGKSTGGATLGGKWFSDVAIDFCNPKAAAEGIRGKWIVELPELSALSRAEVNRVKEFMSRRVDRFRAPYEKLARDYPRTCVFYGTTNESEYLRDATGARRFQPVRVGAIDISGLQHDRDQLWAEAVARYKANEKWWLDTPELRAAAADEADERLQLDPWESIIVEWIEREAPSKVTIAQVLIGACGKAPASIIKADSMRVGAILVDRLHWQKGKQRRDEESKHVYDYYPPAVLPGGDMVGTPSGDALGAGNIRQYPPLSLLSQPILDKNSYKQADETSEVAE